MFDFSRARISFRCPNCPFSNRIMLRDVELGKSVICSGCHCTISLNDKDASTKRKSQCVERSVEELFESVKQFNKTLTFWM